VSTGRWLAALPETAEQSLPAPVWRFIAAGARDGVATAEAVDAWSRYRVVPRVLRGAAPDPSVRLLGETYASPLGVAPTAMQRAVHPDGEVATAAAAASAGVPYVAPVLAGRTFEEIGARADRWWLQVYLPPDRAVAAPVIERALEAGASALVLTVDTPVVGTKYDVADEDWATIDTSWHAANWGPHDPHPWASDLVPADLTWLRAEFGVPVVAKGVLDPRDATACVDAGAAAVWVSNHGGRQLDRCVATADALAGVADAVSSRAQVYVDGGVRSGLDVVTALALGAHCAFVGRPALWALAVGGEAAVGRYLAEMAIEIADAMQLAGLPAVSGAAREVALRPSAMAPLGARETTSDLREYPM